MTDFCVLGHVDGHKPLPAPGGLEGGVPRPTRRGCNIDGCITSVRQSPTHLTDSWALGWNHLQWMLLRARKRHAQTTWQAVSYIADQRSILRRCMAERGCTPDTAGEQFLATLPDTFQDFIKETST